LSAQTAQCPGCGKALFATNATTFRKRAGRHAKSCAALRVFAARTTMEMVREDLAKRIAEGEQAQK
jgi:hypothetical protein